MNHVPKPHDSDEFLSCTITDDPTQCRRIGRRAARATLSSTAVIAGNVTTLSTVRMSPA